MQKFLSLRQQGGRSMVEMLGVLAIMGIITIAAIAMIASAMRSQKRNAVQDDITQIVTGVHQQFAGWDDYSGINPDIIFAQIGAPAKNPFGGSYVINVDPTNANQFIVSMDHVSADDCKFLVGRAWVDSAPYLASDGKTGGATASPSDCSATNSGNIVQITYN